MTSAIIIGAPCARLVPAPGAWAAIAAPGSVDAGSLSGATPATTSVLMSRGLRQADEA